MPTLSAETKASYYDWAKQGQLFVAYATVTTPVIYTTAAGTGGPLLWNNTGAGAPKAVNAVLLAVSAVLTVATSVAAAIGITGGISVLPTSTTAIDGATNCKMGGPASLCNTYRVGTVATAGAFFIPTHTLDTGAITTVAVAPTWVDLGGTIVVPPGGWAAVSASATATSGVLKIALMWAEIPLD